MNTHIDNNDDISELQALMGDYFDALLQEAAQTAVRPASEETEAIHAAEVAPQLIDAEHSVSVMPVAAEAQTEALDAAQSGTPSYQLIRIGGLTLGVPTHCIADSVTAPSQWTPLSDTRAWVLGGYHHGSELFTVVDTAALLVPGSTLQSVSSIVLLAGQGIALACDGIGAQITPDPTQVNWRGAQGKRPWLAGTVREPACALLDIPELIRLLGA